MPTKLISSILAIAAVGLFSWSAQLIWADPPRNLVLSAMVISGFLILAAGYFQFKPTPHVAKYMGCDDALRYIATQSEWGIEKEPNNPYYFVGLQDELKSKITLGELAAAGRPYFTLHGGVRHPRPLQTIPREEWEKMEFDAWRALEGQMAMIGGNKAPNVIDIPLENRGWCDIKVQRSAVMDIWPQPRAGLRAFFYGRSNSA